MVSPRNFNSKSQTHGEICHGGGAFMATPFVLCFSLVCAASLKSVPSVCFAPILKAFAFSSWKNVLHWRIKHLV